MVLPTRLVDLGLESYASSVKLHISKEEENAEYSALNYCWGRLQECALTTQTLEAWTHEIPVKDLPRTLQDAVEITRKLSIRYLWVDALCIV